MSPPNRAPEILGRAMALMAVWRSRKIVLSFLIILPLAGIRCTTAEPSGRQAIVPAEIQPEAQIQPKTLLPTDFSGNFSAIAGTDLVVIPTALLTRSHISRSRADLRSGPGSNFELLDSILEENDKAVIFDTIGVWTKIVSLRLGISGWVHKKTLTDDPESSNTGVKIAVKLLPTVIAVEPIGHVYSYGEAARMPVSIKRGTQFIALRKFNGRTLVWLTKTNSVAWISDQSVK